MTDSTVDVTPATTDQGNGATSPVKTPEAVTSFEAITSQADLDRIIQNRLARERSQYADYDALKEKADKFDQSENEKLDEVQRLTQRAEKAEKEQARLSLENLRRDVADTKGVPASLITGSTKAQMEASADQLIAFKGVAPEPAAPTGPKPNPQQGTASSVKVSGSAKGLEEAKRRGWVK